MAPLLLLPAAARAQDAPVDAAASTNLLLAPEVPAPQRAQDPRTPATPVLSARARLGDANPITDLAAPLADPAGTLNPAAAPAHTAAPTLAPASPEPAPAPFVEASPKRIAGMVPNFQTTNESSLTVPALTPREKFILATHNAFDISAHLGNAFQATILQATDGQPNYGHGVAAYGERFAAMEADQIQGSYLTSAIFPVLFHEDPRYFRLGHGSAPSRVWYALSRAVLTRRDSGGWTLNKSQMVGTLVSNEISTTYYAQPNRNFDGVMLNWAVNMIYKGGYNTLSEYYPDLLARFHHGKKAS